MHTNYALDNNHLRMPRHTAKCKVNQTKSTNSPFSCVHFANVCVICVCVCVCVGTVCCFRRCDVPISFKHRKLPVCTRLLFPSARPFQLKCVCDRSKKNQTQYKHGALNMPLTERERERERRREHKERIFGCIYRSSQSTEMADDRGSGRGKSNQIQSVRCSIDSRFFYMLRCIKCARASNDDDDDVYCTAFPPLP